MTLRVLHCVRPAAGGIRQHVLNLWEFLDPLLVQNSVAAPGEFLNALPASPAPGGSLLLDIAPRLSPGRDLVAASRLAQYIPGRVDLVHAHGLRAAFVTALACRLRPFPFVFTAHNLLTGGRLTRLGVRFAAQAARRVIAITQAVADGLTACGVPSDRIVVIPNGIDTSRFTPRGAPPPEFTVGCVARLSPEKGVDVLLASAKALPDIPVRIAGDGPERGRLTALCPPNALLQGRIADTRELYQGVSVVAVPSRQEGQGIVALEAMASGVPVIASRVGGLAEMLTDGETALLVPPDDPAALADAVRRLRGDAALCRKLAENGQALVQERFEVRAMARSVEDVYRRSISPR